MTVKTYPHSIQAPQNSEKTITFLNNLFPRPRNFAVRLWDDSVIEADTTPRFTFVLKHPAALRGMLRPPSELSLGEAFIRGDFDIEGNISEAFHVFFQFTALSPTQTASLIRAWFALPGKGMDYSAIGRKAAQLVGMRHTRGRDKTAVRYHYDVGNDFYSLWLGKRMVYSCAYFPTGSEDLDAAQEHKLDITCRQLDLKPGERLLDIGCGWGGLVMYAAQKYGVKALGVTLSKQQHMMAHERIAGAGIDTVDVKLMDYRDLKGETFDKIVSIGMFEHVGKKNLPEYFSHVYNLLKPGGLFLNHGIAARPFQETLLQRIIGRRVFGKGLFFNRYIFPDGELVPVSEVNLIAEQTGFEVCHLENWREHYALTLRHWLRRLDENHAEIVKLANEAVYRTWRLYMAASIFGFETGRLTIDRTLLLKPTSDFV